jgi:hypothetical protein
MSLPRLNWKMLPTISLPIIQQSKVEGVLDGIFTLFNSNTYSDGSPRVTGSGVAWTFFRTSSADSGSVRGPTAVVYGFPATMSVMSQSVIFAGSRSYAPASQTPYLHPYASYRGTEGIAGPNLLAQHTSSIYVTIQKQSNPYQYVSWLSPSIFNSGSSGLNTVSSSGFIDFLNFQGRNLVGSNTVYYQFSTINAWESQEAIIVIVSPTGSNYSSINVTNSSPGSFIALAGAWLDPLDPQSGSQGGFSSCENDGRLYGVSCTYSEENSRFQNPKEFFNGGYAYRSNGYNAFFEMSRETTSERSKYGKVGIYIPNVNNCIFSTHIYKTEIGTQLITNLTSNAGNIYAYPMYLGLAMASDWSTSRIGGFGKYRDIYMYPPGIGNGEIYSGSNLLGYTVNLQYRSSGGGSLGTLFLRA